MAGAQPDGEAELALLFGIGEQVSERRAAVAAANGVGGVLGEDGEGEFGEFGELVLKVTLGSHAGRHEEPAGVGGPQRGPDVEFAGRGAEDGAHAVGHGLGPRMVLDLGNGMQMRGEFGERGRRRSHHSRLDSRQDHTDRHEHHAKDSADRADDYRLSGNGADGGRGRA